MPPLISGVLTAVGWPDHQMRCPRTDLVITSRAAIDLGGARRRDRSHLV